MKKLLFLLILLFYIGTVSFDLIILKKDFVDFFIPANFQGVLTIFGFVCTIFAFIVLFRALFLNSSKQRWLHSVYLIVTFMFLLLLTIRFVLDLRNVFSVVFTSTNEALRYVASSLLLPGGYTQSITFILLMLIISIVSAKDYNHKAS